MASREKTWLLHLLAVQPCESSLPSLFLVCKVKLAMAPTSRHSPGTEPGAQWALNAKTHRDPPGPDPADAGPLPHQASSPNVIPRRHHQELDRLANPAGFTFRLRKVPALHPVHVVLSLVYKMTEQFEPHFSVSKRHPSQGRPGSFHTGVLGGRGACGWTHWGDRPPAQQGQSTPGPGGPGTRVCGLPARISASLAGGREI